MKRASTLLILVIALSALLGACAPAATPATAQATAKATFQAPTLVITLTPASSGTTVTDGAGRAVKLAGTATKIVSLAPSNTEILFAIGAGPAVIGRDEFSDYPAVAKAVPSVGGSMGKYNMEQIASLQPDLVLASSLNTPEQIKALEDLKITVYVLANPTDLDGLYANLVSVGNLTGHTDVANHLIETLKQRVAVVTDAVSKSTGMPKVFYELDGTDPSKPWTSGPNTFVDTLIKMAGGVNVASTLKGDYAQISQEELIKDDPDIILLGDGAYGVTADQVAKRPGWGDMKAVKDNKVVAFDDNLVSRPGPRLVDGLETLFKIIHP